MGECGCSWVPRFLLGAHACRSPESTSSLPVSRPVVPSLPAAARPRPAPLPGPAPLPAPAISFSAGVVFHEESSPAVPIPADPFYVILNTAIHPQVLWLAELLGAGSTDPAYHYVDWVRIWQMRP